MDVTGVSCQFLVPLRHEGHGFSVQVGNFLDAVFQDHVAVGHVEGFGIAHIDFFLARSPFTF